MAAMSQTEIVEFFADLKEKAPNDYGAFCRFLDTLFRDRDFSGCFFHTSLHAFCITRSPTYSQWRRQPSLALSVASSSNVPIELRNITTTKPVMRWTTESSSVRYELAVGEFDRLYARFLALHGEAVDAP
jgi:hypothetical protein